mmetsp:Transcript_31951/g.80132  ORF Transcript_31951/g.80132 Transcript_31951/m.80132 type:complete len:103 (+) Transcript_31951:47-355(+)
MAATWLLGAAATLFIGRSLIHYVRRVRSPTALGGKFVYAGFLPQMTSAEASQILGLRGGATSEQIKQAHRRILVANHPDSGGSTYLATKINEARDLLVGKKK